MFFSVQGQWNNLYQKTVHQHKETQCQLHNSKKQQGGFVILKEAHQSLQSHRLLSLRKFRSAHTVLHRLSFYPSQVVKECSISPPCILNELRPVFF
ncbi:hypothetical protein DPMN_008643 [Dreissena polymorpha]|uniref:Uncharacterized protein n=1 Tax=Dreissena polymorpha TaxID=45954 RepID=A0A9D4RZV8_DREPO|nr:hypothetical protein DPMN_008643 [Dreissena polymorpha]